MRRAAPSFWQQVSSLPRGWRTLGLYGALGVTGACSVYTSDLLEETTGIITGGSGGTESAGAGYTSTLGGTTMGGKTGDETPSAGGDGGDGGSADGGDRGDGGVGQGGSTPVGGGVPNGGVGGTLGGNGGTLGGNGGNGGSGAGSGLVDGFEDDNLTLERLDGLGGVWYLVGDGTTGKVAPDPLACTPNSGAPVDLGDYAMHVTATGFTGSGSILGADFRDLKKVYDASRFTGIRFWAKVGAGKNTKHRVQIADATTDQAGKKCVPASTVATEKCDDHFGFDATFTATWTQYSITFKQMSQIGWGKSGAALDKANVYGLQFTAKPNLQVDLWLDQIEFY